MFEKSIGMTSLFGSNFTVSFIEYVP